MADVTAGPLTLEYRDWGFEIEAPAWCGLAEFRLYDQQAGDEEARPEAHAYGRAMVASFNACFTIAEQTGSTPEAVAREIGSMYALVCAFSHGGDITDLQRKTSAARDLLARLQDSHKDKTDG